jgi:cell division protein FtsW
LLPGLPLIAAMVLFVPYRRARLFSFLDPWNDAQGTGYQLVQSLLALGSGGFWGKGSGQSTMKMHYLPESETDFIFSIFGEEMGFLGSIVLLALFFALTFRSYRIAMRSGQWYGTLLAAGVSLMLGLQVLINLGVVTGLLPTKGIPLPFVSSGGSSLVVTLAAVGLVLNVSRGAHKPALAAAPRRGR